jgi:hypothetical protein
VEKTKKKMRRKIKLRWTKMINISMLMVAEWVMDKARTMLAMRLKMKNNLRALRITSQRRNNNSKKTKSKRVKMKRSKTTISK